MCMLCVSFLLFNLHANLIMFCIFKSGSPKNTKTDITSTPQDFQKWYPGMGIFQHEPPKKVTDSEDERKEESENSEEENNEEEENEDSEEDDNAKSEDKLSLSPLSQAVSTITTKCSTKYGEHSMQLWQKKQYHSMCNL